MSVLFSANYRVTMYIDKRLNNFIIESVEVFSFRKRFKLSNV